jgi:hypothetical protein
MRLEPPCQCSDAAMDAGGCYYHGANCFAWILQRLRFVVVEILVLAKEGRDRLSARDMSAETVGVF